MAIMILMLLLGLIDVFAAFALFGEFGGGIVHIVGIFIILKGLYSFFTAMLSKFPFDLLGLIDIAAGVALITPVASWLWIPMFLKGVYSMIVAMFMK